MAMKAPPLNRASRGLPRPGPQFPPAPSDTVDAKLTPGEHVMNPMAVMLMGGHEALDEWNRKGIEAEAGYCHGGMVKGYANGGPVMDWLSDHTGGMIGTNKNVLATKRRSEQLKNGTAAPLPAPVPSQTTGQQPAPPPQAPSGGVTGAYDALQNRQKQIDEAAGYAYGGPVPGYYTGGEIYKPDANNLSGDSDILRSLGSGLRRTLGAPGGGGVPLVNQPDPVPSMRPPAGFSKDQSVQASMAPPLGYQMGKTLQSAQAGLADVGGKIGRGIYDLTHADPMMPSVSPVKSANAASPVATGSAMTSPLTAPEWANNHGAIPPLQSDHLPMAEGYGVGDINKASPFPTSLNNVGQGEGFATGRGINYGVSGNDVQKTVGGIPAPMGGTLTTGFDSKTYADTAGKEAAHNAGMATLRAGGDYQSAYDRVLGNAPALPQVPSYNDALMNKANFLLSQHGTPGDAQKRAQGIQLIQAILGAQGHQQNALATMQGNNQQFELNKANAKQLPTLDQLKAARFQQIQGLPANQLSELDRAMFFPKPEGNLYDVGYSETPGEFGMPNIKTPFVVDKRTGQVKPVQAGQIQASGQAPQVGEIRKGYRYKGGEPGNQASWEKV